MKMKNRENENSTFTAEFYFRLDADFWWKYADKNEFAPILHQNLFLGKKKTPKTLMVSGFL